MYITFGRYRIPVCVWGSVDRWQHLYHGYGLPVSRTNNEVLNLAVKSGFNETYLVESILKRSTCNDVYRKSLVFDHFSLMNFSLVSNKTTVTLDLLLGYYPVIYSLFVDN